jgi:beta-galactosidase beta subunit
MQNMVFQVCLNSLFQNWKKIATKEKKRKEKTTHDLYIDSLQKELLLSKL